MICLAKVRRGCWAPPETEHFRDCRVFWNLTKGRRYIAYLHIIDATKDQFQTNIWVAPRWGRKDIGSSEPHQDERSEAVCCGFHRWRELLPLWHQSVWVRQAGSSSCSIPDQLDNGYFTSSNQGLANVGFPATPINLMVNYHCPITNTYSI